MISATVKTLKKIPAKGSGFHKILSGIVIFIERIILRKYIIGNAHFDQFFCTHISEIGTEITTAG